MITTVTLNPAIDKTIILNDFKYGYVNRVENSREDIGGKGINVSKVIHTLNEKTTAIGFLGQKNSNKITRLLDKEKFQKDFIWINDNTRINTKIVDLKSGITTDLNESGFKITDNDKKRLNDLVQKYAKQSDYMVFSGSVPLGCEKSTYSELIHLAKQYTRTVLDADGELLKEGLKASPYLIKPNIHELENCFGLKIKTVDDVIQTASKVINIYHVKWVLVSMSEQGSVLVSKERVLKANPIDVNVKSSVGAGDSMLGGFLSLYLKNENAAKALEYATACGTLAVTKEGTETFTQEDIEKMLTRVEIEEST